MRTAVAGAEPVGRPRAVAWRGRGPRPYGPADLGEDADGWRRGHTRYYRGPCGRLAPSRSADLGEDADGRRRAGRADGRRADLARPPSGAAPWARTARQTSARTRTAVAAESDGRPRRGQAGGRPSRSYTVLPGPSGTAGRRRRAESSRAEPAASMPGELLPSQTPARADGRHRRRRECMTRYYRAAMPAGRRRLCRGRPPQASARAAAGRSGPSPPVRTARHGHHAGRPPQASARTAAAGLGGRRRHVDGAPGRSLTPPPPPPANRRPICAQRRRGQSQRPDHQCNSDAEKQKGKGPDLQKSKGPVVRTSKDIQPRYIERPGDQRRCAKQSKYKPNDEPKERHVSALTGRGYNPNVWRRGAAAAADFGGNGAARSYMVLPRGRTAGVIGPLVRPVHGVRLATRPAAAGASTTEGQTAAFLRAVWGHVDWPESTPQVLFAGLLALPRRVRDGPCGRRHTPGNKRRAWGRAQKPRPARPGPRRNRPVACRRHGPPRLLCTSKPQWNDRHPTGPSGRLPAQMGGGGRVWIMDNIWKVPRGRCGRGLARAAVHTWLGSPGHRANMLDGRHMRLGVGVAISRRGTIYFVQAFC